MRTIGYLLAIPVIIITYFIVIYTVGLILTQLFNSQFWAVLSVFVIGPAAALIAGRAVISHFNQIHEDKERRQAEEAARKAAEEARIKQHKAEQDGYYTQMIVLGDNSLTLFESMPEYLKSAEEYLNQAEIDFSDGAFAPFWGSIENTAKTLGHFDEGVKNIKNNSSQYTDLIKRYENVPPQFPLESKSVEKLTVGTSTAERMKAIVRTAQRNFQFATIYEQRKTNQILVAGFTNLAQALDQMAWQITASIDNLAGSVESMASTLNESMNTINSRLGDIAEANIEHNSEVVKLESERVAREEKALEMLDNIQHHRKSSLL